MIFAKSIPPMPGMSESRVCPIELHKKTKALSSGQPEERA